jgi:hypothetical protein
MHLYLDYAYVRFYPLILYLDDEFEVEFTQKCNLKISNIDFLY